MTSRLAIYCLLASFAPAVAAAQTAAVPGAGRLSLEEAIRIAIENNRQLQSARLQVDKAETDVETARTRRLPAFDLEVTTSQLLTPVEFSFPQGLSASSRESGRFLPSTPRSKCRVSR
jgi:outer membrane protein TolC